MGIMLILFGKFIEMPEWLSIMCYVMGGLNILLGGFTIGSNSKKG